MTSEPLRLLAVLAHPDDETLGVGSTLASYGATGIETYIVTATRGERSWLGDPALNPGLDVVGKLRERELWCAAQALNVKDVALLDYIEGELDRAPTEEIVAQLVVHLRRVRPQVLITFDPYGFYGHPDHIAISQFTTAAVVAAADRSYPAGGLAHRVSKLYYRVPSQQELGRYQAAFGDLVMQIAGVERLPVPWADEAISTRIDGHDQVEQVWQALYCHQSQLANYEDLLQLETQTRAEIFSTQAFYRAFSLVNGGRQTETDLFAGLRSPLNLIPTPSSEP